MIKITDNCIFSLPCVKGCGSPVETSAFNAEAPTEPAGETVGCRKQLGGIVRLILYEFVKSLSHFFVPKKTTAPFTREPLTDNRKGCPYGTSSFAPYRSQQPLAVSRSLCNSSFSAKITLGSPARL